MGAGQSSCICTGLWLQLALQNSKNIFPFISALFLQADRRLEQLMGAHKHQTRSFHGNSKLPSQPCIHCNSPRPLFKASVRVWRATHTTTLGSSLPTAPQTPAMCWAERTWGEKLRWQKNLSRDPRGEYESNESRLYNKFELGRIYPVEGFQV